MGFTRTLWDFHHWRLSVAGRTNISWEWQMQVILPRGKGRLWCSLYPSAFLVGLCLLLQKKPQFGSNPLGACQGGTGARWSRGCRGATRTPQGSPSPRLPESNSYLLTSDSSSAAKSQRETTALQTIVEEVGGWKWHEELGAFVQAGTIFKHWCGICLFCSEEIHPPVLCHAHSL